MHTEVDKPLVNADIQRMIEFRTILEKMRNENSHTKELENKLLKCFFNLNTDHKKEIRNITSNITTAFNNDHVREALIAFAYSKSSQN